MKLLCGLAGVLFAGALRAAVPDGAPVSFMADPEQAHSDFVEHCAGCHGVGGHSAPAKLPELAGRVGWLMCTPESRIYLMRLPNIAHSRITDNAQLADMLNYMAFVVGGNSAPAHAKPFTPQEVARERLHPMVSGSLKAARARFVEAAIRQCGAPVSLRLNYVGEKVLPPAG